MEFSQTVSDLLYEIQYRKDKNDQNNQNHLQDLLFNFNQTFSSLITHYQQEINFVISRNQIKAILYFYYIQNFLTRNEFEEELPICHVHLRSIGEQFINESIIEINQTDNFVESLNLQKNFNILRSFDIDDGTFYTLIEKVKSKVINGL